MGQPALVINRWSGDGKAEAVGLADAARERGIRVTMLERGDDLTGLAEAAADAGASALGMAGGDGSLGLVAGVAIARDLPFFCVPVGTRNHFALDMGLDRNAPLAALDAVDEAKGEEVRIDYATANDRVFLNNASLGFYAMAVHREGYRASKTNTLVSVIAEYAGRPEAQPTLRFTTPDGREHEHASFVLVSNNPYILSGPPDFGRRQRMDMGLLGIAALTTVTKHVTFARMRREDLPSDYDFEAERFEVRSHEPIHGGVDGEALVFESPLRFRVHPAGLRVRVPLGARPGYEPSSKTILSHLQDLVILGGPGGSGDAGAPDDAEGRE